MAYRSGTYVAFHANNTSDPTESDIMYFNTLKMWKVREDGVFDFVNSHDKGAAVRDSSSKARLKAVLEERLRNSKNMILIVGKTTRFDNDWVPYEISYAVDVCRIPIIAAYPGYKTIPCPPTIEMAALWPSALRERIYGGLARVVHVPFKEKPLHAAVAEVDYKTLPPDGLSYYSADSYRAWGLYD